MGLEPMTSRLEGVRAIQLRQQGRMECFDAGDSLILISVSGTRTRVNRVKADHYNHLNQYGENMVIGIQPKSIAIGLRIHPPYREFV